ncbi:MAG: hypothetical protein ABIJ09_20420 [Pseudomonadota bacterium]
MKHRDGIGAGALLAVLPLFSCQCEKLFPEPVAMGVARLTVRNVGTAISLVAADTRCGFASEAAASSAVLDGEVGHEGTLTLRIDNCVLDFGDLHTVSTDCNGVETKAAGKVTLSGTQTIRGHLTGNPAKPVIPGAADAAEMELSLAFASYQVRSSAADNGLTMEAGKLRVHALPHLGVSASLGVCAVSTTDLTLEHIQYENGVLEVDSGDGVFPAEVPTSDFGAQVGRWGSRENDLKGQLTMWDSIVQVPTVDDTDGLDPDYKRSTFEAAMACKEDLAQPLSYECQSLDEDLAEGLARLAIAAFGRLADAYDEDTRCGFSSAPATDGQQVSGEIGRQDGRVRRTLEPPCTLSWDQPTVLKETCNGVQYIVEGSVSATGSKEVEGWNTGNRDKPIIPQHRQPSVVSLELRFSDFRIQRSDLPYELRLRSGKMSGRISVVVAMDTALHACAKKSSAASVEAVRLDDVDLMLTVDGNAFALSVAGSDLDATNGKVDDDENRMHGTLTMNGTRYTLGSFDAPLPLDPNYDAGRFLLDDACRPDYQHAATDEACSLYPLLGNVAARLLVHSTGALASMINADKDCGFEDTWGVLIWPTEVVGNNGDMGSITWDVEECWQGSPAPVVIKEDCLDTTTCTAGSALVNATRTVTGERESMYLLVDSIVPRDPRSVRITLRDVELRDFVSYDLPAGADEPAQRVTWHGGWLTGTVEPITGENASDLGAYDIPTPIAIFSDVGVETGDATLEMNGLTFQVAVDGAQIQAQNGRYQGQGNSIQGHIVVDGTRIDIAPALLKSEYVQEVFDSSYACTEDLVGILPP